MSAEYLLINSVDDGTSSSYPVTIYYPVRNDFNTENITLPNYTYATASNWSTYNELPAIEVGFPEQDVNTDLDFGEPYLKVLIKRETTDASLDDVHFYARKSSSDDFSMFESSLDAYSAQDWSDTGAANSQVIADNVDHTYYLELDDIAKAVGAESNFDDPTSISLDIEIYVFINNGVISADISDDDISSSYSDGIYLNLTISDQIPNPGVDFTGIKRGDGQLTLQFNGSGVSIPGGHKYNLVATNIGNNDVAYGVNYSTMATSSYSISNEDAATSGELSKTGLKNGQLYEFSMAFQDNYSFVSPFTNSLDKMPLEIEAFIKEKSCFLLSAGFQTDHYVLEYFRMVRDSYLLKTSVGKKFVDFYYSFAPQWAPYVYKSKALSSVVRTLAYIAYGVVKFWLWLLLSAMLLISFGLVRKRSVAA
ncbi:MAG: hypothetical protein HOE90_14825 [Bacteriovoracaceae bacterium]|nr:hypothetical protein [Bacteriovoracaceae bacterium]